MSLLRLARTFPWTEASAERCFSSGTVTLRRLKTYLRMVMSEKWLLPVSATLTHLTWSVQRSRHSASDGSISLCYSLQGIRVRTSANISSYHICIYPYRWSWTLCGICRTPSVLFFVNLLFLFWFVLEMQEKYWRRNTHLWTLQLRN